MNHSKLKGFLYGLATSVTFGLIPLFTLPLMGKGNLAGYPVGCGRCGPTFFARYRIEARPVGCIHRVAFRRRLCQLHRIRQ